MKGQESNPQPHTPRPAALPVKVEQRKIVQVLPNEFNWGEQLGDSLLFLDAQKSGVLPASNPIPWRGNSALTDAAPNGAPLVGGYYINGGEHPPPPHSPISDLVVPPNSITCRAEG